MLSCVCACGLCGKDAQGVILGSSAGRPVSVRTEPGVTTSPGDAAARPVGQESAANCVSSSSLSVTNPVKSFPAVFLKDNTSGFYLI